MVDVRCTEGVTCEGEGVWWGGSVKGSTINLVPRLIFCRN